MGLETIIATTAIVGTVLAGAGTAVNVAGQRKAVAGQKKAEAARHKQMQLDAQRKQRDLFRQAQQARALALSNATSQGAGEGTGLQGGFGQIAGSLGRQSTALNENLTIGKTIFDANYQTFEGQSMSATGKGLQDFGSSLVNSADKFGHNFNNAFAGI